MAPGKWRSVGHLEIEPAEIAVKVTGTAVPAMKASRPPTHYAAVVGLETSVLGLSAWSGPMSGSSAASVLVQWTKE
jgi:hypothetical protein